MDTNPHSDSYCSHCDSLQNATTASHSVDLTPAPMLLALLSSYTDALETVADKTFDVNKAQAPPDSSTLLLTTTQRIRI